ncbi:hypothetical protein RJD24_17495 [Bacillaceae bacterium IKA-2]|nr:hypothetical protein RJD24_17495 [Bacillaceae bacterium IKA-2]
MECISLWKKNYLDYNASTPIVKEVAADLMPYLSMGYRTLIRSIGRIKSQKNKN